MHRLITHLRSNVIAYVALFFAVGGGGGYALAATTATKTIHACEVKKTGELLVKSRCTKSQKAVSWNQAGVRGATGAPGAPAVQAYGSVIPGTSTVAVSNGLELQPIANGEWSVTVTAPTCKSVAQVATVTPQAMAGTSLTPIAYGGGSNDSPIVVTTGYLQSGTFTQSDATGFTIQVECGS